MNNPGIVSLQWNHSNFSVQCLQAICRYTPKSVPILFIDNGSSPQHIHRLDQEIRRFQKEGFNITLKLNNKNIGIAPAMNQGIKWCSEKGLDCCFVCNDIVVGYNWLEELQKGVYKHDKIGAGSPYISPEATYDNFLNSQFRDIYRRNFWPKVKKDLLPEELWQITNDLYSDWDWFSRNWVETRQGIPPLYELFSMVMYIKKSCSDMVGLLDEQFIPSNWEDLDYMVRCNNHGFFRVGVTESIVHHWSNITNRNEFGDNSGEYKHEMTENEKRFHDKWKIFVPRDQIKPGVDGDKYSPAGTLGFSPYEVSDKANNREYKQWNLKTPELYQNYVLKSQYEKDKIYLKD
jgi:GT2 family glycosyltransferase